MARCGPGLITGASDEDPSGIATYSQAGSLFGVNLLWTRVALLAGSEAYAVGEALQWPTGLEKSPRLPRPFYLIIAIAAVMAVALISTLR